VRRSASSVQQRDFEGFLQTLEGKANATDVAEALEAKANK
jgi:hypothetical protein